MKAIIRKNEEHKGIELEFDTKPSSSIREELKAHGFRWHSQKKVWYAKETAERMAYVTKFEQRKSKIWATLERIEEIERKRKADMQRLDYVF